MKSYSFSIAILSLGGFLLAAGCSKPEETSAPPAADLQKKADVVASEAKPAVEPPTPAVQQTSAQVDTQAVAAVAVAPAVVTNAPAQTEAITSKTQSSIDAIRKLLADKKWSEALKMVSDLAATQLTPEQQASVDALKQQALKLGQEEAATKAADQGSKALGGLLQKK